jgi:hypothetical protein
MNKREKHQIFKIYFSEYCLCGNKKKVLRWVCLDCRKKLMKLKERNILNDACKKHAIAANNLLKQIKTKKQF